MLAGGEGMSLTELAEATGQAPATVYRVLSTFEAHGIVEVQPATQLWFVGQEAFRIGSAFLGRTSLVEQARGVMHELMAETGETANLAIADGGQVVFISQVETHEPIRAFFRPGTRGPIHASGIGKALLGLSAARGGAADRARAGAAGLYGADDHRSGAAGRRSWRRSGARGWAMDDEERTEGMRCIAAPIFNEFREATAGVSISGPTGAWNGPGRAWERRCARPRIGSPRRSAAPRSKSDLRLICSRASGGGHPLERREKSELEGGCPESGLPLLYAAASTGGRISGRKSEIALCQRMHCARSPS